ncbi:MAG: ECF transporter S component [Clostridia bacterium]|nr:ECF transporter S component [Clostridia bacterium]
MKASRRMSTKKLVMGAILTALVVVLQFLALVYRALLPMAPFTISLVLVPIVLGAALCDTRVSGWLGFVFGVIVLFTDAGAFLAINMPATVLVVLVKGTAAGLAAGLVYSLLEKKNRYLATVTAAVVCPVVNTGIFLLGCRLFFFETIKSWGLAGGFDNALAYMILGLVGLNFLIEVGLNLVLSPSILRLVNIRKKAAE